MPTIRNYLSLIKFSHTIFAMPFALIGFVLGYRHNAAHILYSDEQGYYMGRLLLVVLCMVFARSAAMAFNRYLDRKWDALNPRTAVREIPKGIITPRNALAFTLVNCLLFLATTWFINSICFYLSPVALAVVLGYSYTKRFTQLCHLVLGVGLALAPIGAYLAVTGSFHWLPVVFSLAVIFWVSGFDIIYALQDVDFDRSQRLFSMPASLGQSHALRASEILHLLSVAAVVCAGIFGDSGWLYWGGVAVFAGCLAYQHSIVKPGRLERVNLAFMTMNGIASVVFALFVIADQLLKQNFYDSL